MTWRREYPKLAWLIRQPAVKKARAILEDLVLVLVAILASKIAGAAIDLLISSPWLREAMQSLKGYGLLVLYTAFLCELLDQVGFWELLKRLYNFLGRGQSNGSNTALVA